jgi:hypothetical protein
MAQSNYNIPNDSAPAVRTQLNSVFQSIASNNSGTSAPATTFPHQWWYDSTDNILKQRNAADSAWINIGTFDQTGGTFTPSGVSGASVISALGFTPVEQGGGTFMGNNKVRIGWDGPIGQTRLQIDDSQMGVIVTNRSAVNANASGTLLAPGAAFLYACRAWVNFDGFSGVMRGAGNVSSISKLANGRYQVNFAISQLDANYSVVAMADLSNRAFMYVESLSTTSVRVSRVDVNGGNFDTGQICVAVFR